MSNERLYYIQAIDKWLTYTEAHEYGYTLSRSLLETYYTQDLQPVQIRVDSESGELYDLRVQAHHGRNLIVLIEQTHSQLGIRFIQHIQLYHQKFTLTIVILKLCILQLDLLMKKFLERLHLTV